MSIKLIYAISIKYNVSDFIRNSTHPLIDYILYSGKYEKLIRIFHKKKPNERTPIPDRFIIAFSLTISVNIFSLYAFFIVRSQQDRFGRAIS